MTPGINPWPTLTTQNNPIKYIADTFGTVYKMYLC